MTGYVVDRNWLGRVWRTGLIALTLIGAALAWRGSFAPRVAADESTKDGATSTSLPEGWTTGAPRAELRPEFEHRATGGWKDGPRWIVRTDGREGQVGWWETTLPVEGGQAYRFEVRRRVEALTTPRQSCYARVFWQDEKGGNSTFVAANFSSEATSSG